MNDNVKFGLKNIPKSEKTDKVSEVFSSVAKKYEATKSQQQRARPGT